MAFRERRQIFHSQLVPPRINNLCIPPIAPVTHQISTLGIFKRVFDYFLKWLGQIKDAVVAVFLPKRAAQPEFPGLRSGIALETGEVIENAFDLIASGPRVDDFHLVVCQPADEVQVVGHEAVAEEKPLITLASPK